MQEQMPFII